MNRSRSGYVYIVLCAVIFSTMEVMLKTVHGVFAPMQITCLRFLVGGILLIPFASRSIKKKNASLSRKDIGFFAHSDFGGRVALWRGGAEPLYRRAAL